MPVLGVESGVELHYEDADFTDPWRSTPTMLLQLGFSRSGKSWYNWVLLLSRQFRIPLPRYEGNGLVRHRRGPVRNLLDIFVDNLRSILDHLEMEDVVSVGESFGGIIGLNFAHKYTQHNRALVLCHPLPPAYLGASRQERRLGHRLEPECRSLVHRHHRQPAGHPGGAAGTQRVVDRRN